jgi:hypothetical protein
MASPIPKKRGPAPGTPRLEANDRKATAKLTKLQQTLATLTAEYNAASKPANLKAGINAAKRDVADATAVAEQAAQALAERRAKEKGGKGGSKGAAGGAIAETADSSSEEETEPAPKRRKLDTKSAQPPASAPKSQLRAQISAQEETNDMHRENKAAASKDVADTLQLLKKSEPDNYKEFKAVFKLMTDDPLLTNQVLKAAEAVQRFHEATSELGKGVGVVEKLTKQLDKLQPTAVLDLSGVFSSSEEESEGEAEVQGAAAKPVAAVGAGESKSDQP